MIRTPRLLAASLTIAAMSVPLTAQSSGGDAPKSSSTSMSLLRADSLRLRMLMHLDSGASWAALMCGMASAASLGGSYLQFQADPCGAFAFLTDSTLDETCSAGSENAGWILPVATAGRAAATAESNIAGDPAPPTLVNGNKFSFVIIPDTQAYSEDYSLSPTSTSVGNRYAQRFYDQTTWIVNHRAAYKISFVSHVGDLVQNFNHNNASEWNVARTAMNMLHPGNNPQNFPFVPYAVSLGNHDFDSQTQGNLASTKFVSEYGPNHFKNAQGQFHSFYKGSDLGWKYIVNNTVKEKGKGNNSYQQFNAGAYSFLHITLQCAPTNGSIAWAQTIINAHPRMRTILSTHAFILGGGTLSNFPGDFVPAGIMGRYWPNLTNDAAAIWDKFIRNNDQIFMVLCGHTYEQEHIILQNDADHSVLVYEACFHLDSHGGRITRADQQGTTWLYTGPDDDDRNGSGWLGLLVFDPDASAVTWYTYSPTLDVWGKDIAPSAYPAGMTTYPWGHDVIVQSRLNLNDLNRFAP